MPVTKRRLADTVNGRLLDRAVGHALQLQRYSNGLTREVVGFLNAEVFPDLLERLRGRLDRIKLRGYDSGVESTARYAGMLDDLSTILKDGTKEAYNRTRRATRVLARVEAGWQFDAVKDAVPGMVVPHLGKGVDLRVAQTVVEQPIQGRVQSDWWESLAADTQRKLESQLGIGLAQGETVDQLVQRVRGTQANRYEDGLLQVTRRQAESIVRTSATHISAQAREQTYREMSRVIKGVQWVSTLDTRTTPICINRDGKVYDIGDGPRPPAHWGCRSTTVPVTRSFKEILGRSANAAAPESTRASMDGQVADTVTAAEWLEQQSPERQAESLGATRAAMLRRGEIAVRDLTNNRGSELSVEQLRAG